MINRRHWLKKWRQLQIDLLTLYQPRQRLLVLRRKFQSTLQQIHHLRQIFSSEYTVDTQQSSIYPLSQSVTVLLISNEIGIIAEIEFYILMIEIAFLKAFTREDKSNRFLQSELDIWISNFSKRFEIRKFPMNNQCPKQTISRTNQLLSWRVEDDAYLCTTIKTN